MNSTIVDLTFTELPDLPEDADAFPAEAPRFLLSLWDCSSVLADWMVEAQQFYVGDRPVNHDAIRSWARLAAPVDRAAWGDEVVTAAKSNDKRNPAAGWLQERWLRRPGGSWEEMDGRSHLPATSCPEAPAPVREWMQAVVRAIKEQIGDGPIFVAVSAYRHNGCEYVTADFGQEGAEDLRRGYSMTFAVGGRPDRRFHLEEPSVPDAVEAISNVGEICKVLQASVTIGSRH